MGLEEAQSAAEQISNDLLRAKWLGTTRPTDEEIQEVVGQIMDASEDECEICNAANNIIGEMDGCPFGECEPLLAKLIREVTGWSEAHAASLASTFLAMAKQAP